MKYQLINRVFECWQIPTTIETEVCKVPDWVMNALLRGAANINNTTKGHWLVKSRDDIHRYTQEEFTEQFEPWQEPERAMNEPSFQWKELLTWAEAVQQMEAGHAVIYPLDPSRKMTMENGQILLNGSPAHYKPCESELRQWKVIHKESEPFDWTAALRLMQDGQCVAFDGWRSNLYLEWNKMLGRPVLVDLANGSINTEFTPENTSLNVWRLWRRSGIQPNFDWNTAVEHMKNGRSVRRASWVGASYLKMVDDVPTMFFEGSDRPKGQFIPTDNHTDWILA